MTTRQGRDYIPEIKIGLSEKPLYVMDVYDSAEEGFLDRYKDYFPNAAQLQTEFAKDMFNLIANDIDTSKVTVVPARCGVGKSTTISALISYFTTYDTYDARKSEAIGMVIVTDTLERLKEYQADPTDVQSIWGDLQNKDIIKKHSTYISSDNEKTTMKQLVDSQYKPVVLLTTQRYFSMPEEFREMLFEYRCNNQKFKREIVIFDEKPYFSNASIIKIKNFNDVDTSLQEGIAENQYNSEDKDWILEEYRKFRDKMQNLLRQKEKTSTNCDYFYWKDKNTENLTSNDDRFFELIEEYKSSICKVYQNAFMDLKDFKTLMKDGAFFVTKKKSKLQKYETYFELYQDNRDKFFLQENKAKFFVFDATADIDPDYNVDYVHFIDVSKYNISIKMQINFLNVSSSKSQLVNNSKTKDNINPILEEIKNLCCHKGFGRTLIISYKSIVDCFKYNDFIVKYFGNIKGMNNFYKDTKCVVVGTNRFNPFTYFIKYISQRPYILKELAQMCEEESRKYIKTIIKVDKQTKSIFNNQQLNEIMFKSIFADFEQNIFRTAIRNFDNKNLVNVYVFWSYDTFNQLNQMIEDRYSPYKVEFNYLGIPDTVLKAKTLTRKTKDGKKTNPQKILKWYDQQEKEKVFKLSEMLSDLEMNNNQFKRSRQTNLTIQTIFKNSRTEKQGYYKVI